MSLLYLRGKTLLGLRIAGPVSALLTALKFLKESRQVSSYVDQFLSSFICGYRKGFSTKPALQPFTERWKTRLIKMDMVVQYLWIFIRVLTEAVVQRCSVKKLFLKISQQACNFIKKETLGQVFFCEFCENFRNTCFYITLLAAAQTNKECFLRKTDKECT